MEGFFFFCHSYVYLSVNRAWSVVGIGLILGGGGEGTLPGHLTLA